MITFNKMGSYGRFGNQMFQYATIYSVAKTANYDFGIPLSNKSSNEYNSFILDECFKNLTAKNSFGHIPRHYFQENNFEYNQNIFGIPDHCDICGYFQSEKYFKHYRNDLLKEFNFNEDIQKKAKNIREQIKEDVISLHIRLGDYVKQQQNHPVCSLKYYKNALNKLPQKSIFVFSDDIEQAKNLFNSLKGSFIFIENTNKYIDMCIMSMCDYHIIANSSFSWWGAWLSESKTTIAPSKWFGDSPTMPKNWSDVYCKNWIVI